MYDVFVDITSLITGQEPEVVHSRKKKTSALINNALGLLNSWPPNFPYFPWPGSLTVTSCQSAIPRQVTRQPEGDMSLT